jgi:hypothetical protein
VNISTIYFKKREKLEFDMSNFLIFEDQENLQDKAVASFADAKRDRQKLAPLTNKAIFDENAIENQVRKKFRRFVLLFIPRTFSFNSLRFRRTQRFLDR